MNTNGFRGQVHGLVRALLLQYPNGFTNRRLWNHDVLWQIKLYTGTADIYTWVRELAAPDMTPIQPDTLWRAHVVNVEESGHEA